MARESSIVATASIQAPIEAVWKLSCDSSRYAEWVENTLKVIRSDGPARLGATYEELTRVSGPWKTETRWKVAEFDAPRRQVHDGEGVPTATGMAVIIELTPISEATTVLTLTIRYTPRFGPVGALLDRGVRGSLGRAQQRSAEAFAALVMREQSSIL